MPLILLLLSLLLIPAPAFCAQPEDELRKVEEQLREQKRRLQEARDKESSVLDDIDVVNRRLNKVVTEVLQQRDRLRRTRNELNATIAEIDKTKTSLKRKQEWLKRKLRIMYRYGYSGDILLQLMSAQDISDLMRVWKYLQDLSRHEHAALAEYRQTLALLSEKQKRLAALEKEIAEQTDRVRSKEAELAEEKQTKESMLHAVRSEKVSRQKMISELRQAQKRLQELMQESAKKDDYAGTGFGQMRGRLPWPAEGKVAVPYGTQRDPQFDTPIFRNGIHIQTTGDAGARAVYPGKVIFAEWFKGFGQLVIVNHGNGYHTLYGNLSEIFSKVGDIIKERETIGKVGVSGVLNSDGLYFEIRYKGKPLDPAQWLGKRK